MSKKSRFAWVLVALLSVLNSCQQASRSKDNTHKGNTAFQTSISWKPEIDVRSDIAIVYGAHDRSGVTFEQRVQSWKNRGYETHFMTGIAWGGYRDYYLGKWDGKNHLDVTQQERNNKKIIHGDTLNPYVVPVDSYIEYMKEAIVKKVIDAGISSLYLEEPEFWARAGYSELFKKEWKKYYGFNWRPQHESPENTYLSNKLKYQLYYRAIEEVSSYAKEYGQSRDMDVKVYIPTHSLVNYSAWKIVSPEASLASLPGIDGYIAQVWTGTSRTPTYFDGIEKERVFENAFLEYGSMESMTAPTNRKVYFLTDPIEDRPRDWADYKRNYQATFTAQLLYPMVNDYEVMPWPRRIYTRPYKISKGGKEELIPKPYATQMQVMINALNNMPVSDNQVSGSHGIGVLMNNSLMFQRFPVHDGYTDPRFSNFYGQTLPLLKRGIPVETVHMENLKYDATLKDIQVLVMSYANMKPLSPQNHHYLAEWVKNGGVLIYCGRDNDPYQRVREWWNTGENEFKAPSRHLFRLLAIDPPWSMEKEYEKKYTCQKGTVYVIRQNPKEFVMEAGGDQEFIKLLREAYDEDAAAGTLSFKNSFYLERGPFDIISVMDEGVEDDPFVARGPFIDLFDPKLPVLNEKIIYPGNQAFLYNMNRIKNPGMPQVLASASRISAEQVEGDVYSFICKSPKNTVNSMRILLPAKPENIEVTGPSGREVSNIETSWHASSHTCFMGFENSPDGIRVSIGF